MQQLFFRRLWLLLAFSLLLGCTEKNQQQETNPADTYQEAVKRLQATKSSKDPKELFDAVVSFGKVVSEKRISEISPAEKAQIRADYFNLAVPLLLTSAEMGNMGAKLVLAGFLEKGVEPELKADPEKARRYQSDIDASDDPVILLLGEKSNKCASKDDLLPEKLKRLELTANKGLSLARWKIAKCHLDVPYAIYKNKQQEYSAKITKIQSELLKFADGDQLLSQSATNKSHKLGQILKEETRELYFLSRSEEFRDAFRMIDSIPATKDSPELMAEYDAIRFVKDPRSKNPYEDDLRVTKRNILSVLSIMVARSEIGAATSDSFFVATKLATDLASKGDAQAQQNLGHWYINGYGVPKDSRAGFEWLLKAADQGDQLAQKYLAALYLSGTGVERDLVLAYSWLNICAAQNDYGNTVPDSVMTLRESDVEWLRSNLVYSVLSKQRCSFLRGTLEKMMPVKDLATAQSQSRNWKPGHSKDMVGSNNGSAATEAVDGNVTMTGSGFYISADGHILTNNHVVRKCSSVRVGGDIEQLRVIGKDEVNDLALLKSEKKHPDFAFIRDEPVKQGESIFAFGYPLSGYLSSTGNFTNGVIAATTGPSNDSGLIQITSPVQPGNSGGPVVDSKGSVVGVVVGKADAIKVAKITGDIPQNVNFAITTATVKAFLGNYKVETKTPSFLSMKKETEDIASDVKGFSVPLECLN